MRDKRLNPKIDTSDLWRYPNGRIKNSSGNNDGTPVNEEIYGDLHEMKDELMRRAGISHNNLPDNMQNGYQLIDALIALASKNDYVLNLTNAVLTTEGIGGEPELSEDVNRLSVPIKLGKIKDGESFILKANINKGTQTQVKGSDNVVKPVTFIGDFKIGEYLRFVYKSNTVTIIRLVDLINFDLVASEFGYLKPVVIEEGLTEFEEEDPDPVNDKGITPLSFQSFFNALIRQNTYLATPANNGAMSKEDKAIVDAIGEDGGLLKFVFGSGVAQSFATGYNDNNFTKNYVDVFPPAGKTMANFKSITPSISVLNFAGDVGLGDRVWCKWRVEVDRIRIIAGASEMATAPVVQWSAIWQ